jgi:hypothetical protein
MLPRRYRAVIRKLPQSPTFWGPPQEAAAGVAENLNRVGMEVLRKLDEPDIAEFPHSGSRTRLKERTMNSPSEIVTELHS